MIEKKKRKGTRGKGRAFEKRCAEILEEYGFATYIAPPKLGWYRDPKTGEMTTRSVSQDIFGCIDIVAKRNSDLLATIWIQCGERTSLWKKKKDVREFGGWGAHDFVTLFIKNNDRTISVFYLCTTEKSGPHFLELGKFDTRRVWTAAVVWPDFTWGTRTPKERRRKS